MRRLCLLDSPGHDNQLVPNESDGENIRVAWRWVLGQSDPVAIKRAGTLLQGWYHRASLLHEGAHDFALACTMLQQHAEQSEPWQRARSHSWAAQAHFLRLLGTHEPASAAASKALAIAHAVHDIGGEINALIQLGDTATYLGDGTASRAHFEAALVLARMHHLEALEADILRFLGNCEQKFGETARGIALLEQALTAYRSLDRQQQQVWTLCNLGFARRVHGDLAGAHDAFAEGLSRVAMQQQRAASYFYCGLGEIALLRGDLGQATVLLAQANAAREEVPDSLAETVWLAAMCQLKLAQGEASSALTYSKRLLDNATHTANAHDYAHAWLLRGRAAAHIAVSSGDARTAFKRAACAYATLGHRRRCIEAVVGLTQCVQASGEHEYARLLLESVCDRADDSMVADAYSFAEVMRLLTTQHISSIPNPLLQ